MRTNALVAIVLSGLTAVAALPDAAAEAATPAQEASGTRQLFAVEIKTGSNWDGAKPANEQAYFKEHSENLRQLREAGYIVLGARYSDIGLIVFSATSADEVRRLMERDPSMKAGTFRYAVHRLSVFYPGTVGIDSTSND